MPFLEDELRPGRPPSHGYTRAIDILALGLIVGDATGVDQALQYVGRFAAIEHA